MSDLIELAKQQAAEIACAGHNGWGNTMLELAAALEAAREDAERYRWLREEGSPDSDSGVAVSIESWGDWGRPQTTYPSGADLDAAIDQARGKGVQGG